MEKSRYSILSLSHRWHDAVYWLLLLAACLVFYWMNCLTPFKEDDMLHSLVIGELTHVQSLDDLMRSYVNKFLITNGRTSDMVAELFCGLLGKPLFNVLNTVMFGLLAHMVSLLSTGRRSLLAQAMLYGCIGTCYPVPGETMLWLAGSCNYLWTITGTLMVLYYLVHHRDTCPGWPKAILILLGAMIAGAGNESVSFGFLGGMGVYYAVNRSRIDRTVVITMLGYLLGVLLIMASPAAWERASDGGIAVDMPLLQLLTSRCYIVGSKMVTFITPVIACLVGVITLFGKGIKSLAASVWPYLMVFLMMVMLVFGMNPDRPYAGWVTVCLIITVMAVDVSLRRLPLLRAAIVVAGLALSSLTFARGIQALSAYRVIDQSVVGEIRNAPSQVVLRENPYKGYNRFVYPLPMKSDAYFPNEYTWRAYFDKENIQFVSDSVYQRYHTGRLLDGAVDMPFSSNRPALTGKVMAFPNQDYMVLPLHLDTIPTAYQVGMAYWSDPSQAITADEHEYRRRHALMTNGNPIGYYPLRYEGQVMMVLPLVSNRVDSMLLLLDYAGNETLTLYRDGLNDNCVARE